MKFRFTLFLTAACICAGQVAVPDAIFYDDASRPIAFAVNEIQKAAPGAIPEYRLNQAGGINCKYCLTISAVAGGGKNGSAQSYAIRRTGNSTVVIGADPAGAMYGGLDIAEAIRIGTFASLASSEHAPYISQRGIKFNIPLDARTPTYSDNSDAAQANIPEMWSFDFWREFIDEMARHRYNVLSLWSLHPFPSMVKVPEFTKVALADVKRTTIPLDNTYSHTGSDMVRPATLAHLETVRTISIEDKIQFWRDVMRYAKDHGIDTYVITWNIFTFGAEGQYGITKAQDNPVTIAYFRASVREMVLAYPDLAGMGITAGEQMENRSDEFSKEKWLWQTYGEGVRDALRKQPGRQFRMIHRYHQTGQTEILDQFKDYPGPFDLSFKYSIAHMYSIPNPPYINDLLPGMPPGRKTWLTVRNDDIYSFRWANIDYARQYLRNIPPPDKIAGFYMGPDGYIWGREFLSRKTSHPRPLVISKQWLSFLLWGRLSYDPDLSDAQIHRVVGQRFPEVDPTWLMDSWSPASMVFPLITRFFWGDIDLRWFPEACLSHPRHQGWFTVRHFIEGSSMPGSGVLNILEWRKIQASGGSMTGATPIAIADALADHAERALAGLPRLRQKAASYELQATLNDIEAMAYLGQYYAAKIRGAASLAMFDLTAAAPDQAAAVRSLEAALRHWRDYARVYSAQYKQPVLYNRVGVVDIPALIANVDADVEMARSWKPKTIDESKLAPRRSDRPFSK